MSESASLVSQINHLNEITLKILGNKDVVNTSSAILSTMKSHLDAYGGVIYMLDEKKKKLYTYAFSSNRLINMALADVAKNYEKYLFPIDSQDQLISKCFVTNTICQSLKLRDFYAPIVDGKHVDIIQKILGVKLSITVPLNVYGKSKGVIFLAFKNKSKLTKNDWAFIQFYANLSSLALENNSKFIDLQKKYELEKETTAMLSHELRTPIAIAQSSVQTIQILLDKYKEQLDSPLFQKLSNTSQDVLSGIDRLTKISNSIFHLREVETNIPIDVQKIDLVESFAPILRVMQKKAAGKNLKLTHNFGKINNNYFAGIIQLEQIVTVLLDNAVKYTKKGSINLSIEAIERKLVCRVSDTGETIPSKKRELIFQKFFRHFQEDPGGKKPEGMGLGLYIAKKITEKLNGQIYLESDSSIDGNCFVVEIPIYESQEEAQKALSH